MKIKNRVVSIKVGKKQYDLKNLITNNCLTRFARSQLEPEKYNYIPYDKEMSHCLLKFDEPLNIYDDIELHNQDFDICFAGGTSFTQKAISDKKVDIKYVYDTAFIYDYQKSTTNNIHISDYYGKKITAIGFNSWFSNDANNSTKLPIMAVIDTQNYNIYLQEGQDLRITRSDTITSDAEFYCENSKVNGPLHLIPGGGNFIIKPDPFLKDDGTYLDYNEDYLNSYGFLYSMGLSSWPTNITGKELIIGKDIDAIQIRK